LAVSSSERHLNEVTRQDLPVLLAKDPNRLSEKLLLRRWSRRSRKRWLLVDQLNPLCHPAWKLVMVKRLLKRKLLVDELLLLDYALEDHSGSACLVSEVTIPLR
jgi:hypothetical protein